ncbi:hypothetical protein E2320_002957, partial [Naja naja]
MKIPTTQSRHKVFSTCTPHLTVFSLFIITAVFSYMRPKSLSTPSVDLLSAVLYTALPPEQGSTKGSYGNTEKNKNYMKFLHLLMGLLPQGTVIQCYLHFIAWYPMMFTNNLGLFNYYNILTWVGLFAVDDD